jgi:crotonobetainyl-CoA:carnitine CoA-transferase CaiB-like acyl-CoA transferase
MQAVRNPVILETGALAIRRPAPLLGEHTSEILQELGYTQDQIKAWQESGLLMLSPKV